MKYRRHQKTSILQIVMFSIALLLAPTSPLQAEQDDIPQDPGPITLPSGTEVNRNDPELIRYTPGNGSLQQILGNVQENAEQIVAITHSFQRSSRTGLLTWIGTTAISANDEVANNLACAVKSEQAASELSQETGFSSGGEAFGFPLCQIFMPSTN